jgi:ferredoxin
MKATVDQDLCVGCGLCADTCPQVFVMEGDLAATIADDVPAAAADACRDAADACPVDAITIDE